MLSIPMPTIKRFDSIIQKLTAIDTLCQVSAVLSWDQETMMPPDAIHARATQIETMSGLIHDAWSHPSLADEMSEFIQLSDGKARLEMTAQETAFMRELFVAWKSHTRLSKPLVKDLSKVTALAQHAWQEAKEKKDYAIFLPHLKSVVALTQKKAQELGFQQHPYNALVNEFEPGMTVDILDNILLPLKEATTKFLKSYTSPRPPKIIGSFDIQRQMDYSKYLMAQVGYTTTAGRLDESVHPMTINIHPTDVRLTTRFCTDNLFESISSTMHELGHGLYEQGLDPEWAETPYGQARSMAVHESQSRLWEIFIGQSLAFWQGQHPKLKALFSIPQSPIELFHASNAISPQWCRVASDVVSYNLHIIIRYECEKDLISGRLSPHDLPEVWNKKMKDYLGVTVANDAEGCLQDVHWSAGLFGYFPSYTLGTLMAASLYETLEKTMVDLADQIAAGHFLKIKAWLNQHVHRVGSKKTIHELAVDLGVDYSPGEFFNRIGHMIP
jgi:carboxypeptidase Taq